MIDWYFYYLSYYPAPLPITADQLIETVSPEYCEIAYSYFGLWKESIVSPGHREGWFSAWTVSWLPMTRDRTPWIDEAEYRSYFPTRKISPVWALGSRLDRVCNLVTNGPGRLRLKSVAEGYRLDLSHLADYPVRDGFHRYGVVADFDLDRQLTRLEWLGQPLPIDSALSYSVLVSSLLLETSVIDHELFSRMYVAGQLRVALQRTLRETPSELLTQLIVPFTYGIERDQEHRLNYTLQTKGVLNRMFALTTAGFEKYLTDTLKARRFHRCPEDQPIWKITSDLVEGLLKQLVSTDGFSVLETFATQLRLIFHSPVEWDSFTTAHRLVTEAIVTIGYYRQTVADWTDLLHPVVLRLRVPTEEPVWEVASTEEMIEATIYADRFTLPPVDAHLWLRRPKSTYSYWQSFRTKMVDAGYTFPIG